MAITTLSSRELRQDTCNAKKTTRQGPVIITNRGEASHVMLSIEDFQKISVTNTSIVELLVMPEAAEIEFEIKRTGITQRREVLS